MSGRAEREQEQIDAEARELVLRLHQDGTPEDRRAAERWRAADPRHEAAFRDADHVWAALGQSRHARDDTWRDEDEDEDEDEAPRSAARRPMLLALAAAVALTLVAAPALLLRQSEARIATHTAETRTLSLADGSRVFLGARSAIDVDLEGGRRRVELADGEAFFDVVHDPKRPFEVIAGNAVVRVLGTRFNVRRVGDNVQVDVQQGRVEVRRRTLLALVGAKPPQRVVGAQQKVRLENGGKLTPVAPIGVAEAGAWREGRLMYADTPLKEVIADANRYSAKPIRYAPEAIGDLRVTATFRTDAVERLLTNLDAALPIRIERGNAGEILLTGEPG